MSERGPLPALGWTLLGATLLYVGFIHHGIAPTPESAATEWWHARGSLLNSEPVASLAKIPGIGIAMLTTPALLSSIGVFVTTRSAWARALATAATVSVMLFAFYAFVGRPVWAFFAWRGTLVLVGTGTAVGLALSAPLLARSWLRQRASVQVALYLPLLLGVVAFMRHTTGTNPAMAYNVSPWPAIAVVGLDVAVYTIGGVQLGLAAGLTALAIRRHQPLLAALLALSVPSIPIIWLLLRHPSPGLAGLALLATVAALAVALSAAVRGSGARLGLERRAMHIALGAALTLLPVIAGQSLAAGDFAASRFVRAQSLIDPLHRYFEEKGVYPDVLEELIEGHYLDEIPRPRVGFDFPYGFGWLEPVEFRYQNLGSSYVLEFEATEWVQCAYNPPWAGDEEPEEEGEVLEVEEVWSCPGARPDLW